MEAKIDEVIASDASLEDKNAKIDEFEKEIAAL